MVGKVTHLSNALSSLAWLNSIWSAKIISLNTAARIARSETISGSDANDLKLLAHKQAVNFFGQDVQRAEKKANRISRYHKSTGMPCRLFPIK
jgi:hypothetical protein